jgi:formiminotetrahydrofolate cyclodeaminase
MEGSGLSTLLEHMAHGDGALGGGSAAAMTASLAAAVVAMAARASRGGWIDAGGAIAQAEVLRARLTPRIAAGPEAYSRARMLLARAGQDRGQRGLAAAPSSVADLDPEAADRRLQAALREAAIEPLLVAETAADIAVVASWVATEGSPDYRADAVAAALLADAAAQAAAHLVRINLSVRDNDELAQQASAAARSAAAAREQALQA